MPRLLLCTALFVLPLAACDRPGETASVTINADGGNVAGTLDRNGGVKIDVPGFSGQIKLPKLQVNSGNFDLNGVRLYPGSTIEGMDIGAGKDTGVRVRFSSPATPDRVRDWFEGRLARAGFTLTRTGQGLTGTTEEDKPFRLDLTGNGADHAQGTIVLGG